MHFYLPLIIFSLAASVTPGPNNISLMMIASAHGAKKTIPQCFGVILGYPLMLFIIGCGLGGIFIKYPIIHSIIKTLGSCYILYMAWKIIHATIDDKHKTKGKPITFLQSLLFQWVNPKGLVTAISAVSAYTDIHSATPMLLQVAIVAIVAVLATSMGAIVWIFGGTIIKKLLKNNVHLKVFNCFMAALLVLSVLLIVLE